MGNLPSAEVNIRVDGIDEEPYEIAQAGSFLNGEVRVRVNRTIENLPVKIILCGYEVARAKVLTKGKTEVKQAEHVFYTQVVSLPGFRRKKKVRPGIYSMNFSVKLPRKLPSSDSSKNNKKKKPGYSITYTVTAKLGKKFKASTNFDVDAVPIPSKVINRWYRPREFQVKKDSGLFGGGVSDDGRVVMGAMLNSCVVGRGENIELFLACRNDSTTPIRCVRIEIIEYRQCSFGQDPRKNGDYDVLKAVQSLSLPSSCNAQDKESVGQYSKDVLCKQVYKELKRRRDPILITIPKDSRDTYKGSLVHIWHCVKITYELKCRQRSNDVVAFMPIKIGRVPDSFHVPTAAPSVFDIESVGDNSSVASFRTINSAALTTCSVPLSTVAPLRSDDSSEVSSSKSNSPETNYKLPIPLTKQLSIGSVSTRSFSPSVNSTIYEESEFVAHDDVAADVSCLRFLASPSSIGNRSRSSFQRHKAPPRNVSSSIPVEV